MTGGRASTGTSSAAKAWVRPRRVSWPPPAARRFLTQSDSPRVETM